jgi:hypothetical protein
MSTGRRPIQRCCRPPDRNHDERIGCQAARSAARSRVPLRSLISTRLVDMSRLHALPEQRCTSRVSYRCSVDCVFDV